MILLFKIALIICLLAICYQDSKERMVYWFLFPLAGLALGVLHQYKVGWEAFILHCIFNVIMVTIILSVLWIYSYFRFKGKSFTENFGVGDVLVLYVLCLAFAPFAFLTLLVFGLGFSLLLHVALKQITFRRAPLSDRQERNNKEQTRFSTVPLAGYLALFFAVAITMQWFGIFNELYIV